MNFLPLAASLALGIYSAQYLPQLIVVISALVFILLSIITIRAGKKLRIDAVFMVAVFVIGMFLYNFNSTPRKGKEYNGAYVTLYGCVISLPYETNGINRYTVYAEEIEYNGSKQPFNSKVIVNSEEVFRCGDNVTVHGQLRQIKSNSPDDVFISQNYYASKEIFFKTTALSMLPSDFVHRHFSVSYAANLLKSKCSDLIRKYYQGDIAAAMIAIITGDKHGFSEDYNAVLEYTGTRHLFYPAFIHITLISLFIGLFSQIVPRRIRDIVFILALTLYMLFGASASSIKSAAVLMLLILSKNTVGSGTYMNSLSLFVMITIFVNPMLLFDAGFVYSLTSSVIIRTFTPIFNNRNVITRFIAKYLVFTVGLSPLTLYLFGRLSIYSFLASAVFIPLLSFILVISPLFMLSLAFNFTPIAWIVHKFIMVLLHIPVFIDALPFSYLTLHKPSVVFIIAFYLAMAAIWYSHKKMNIKKSLCIVISMGLFCSQLVYVISNSGKIHINFIDVGQGDATLIQRPFKSNILIDGGGSSEYSTYNIGEEVFLPYLADHGAGIVQAAFVSHYHNDHTEGIAVALERLNVKNLFLPDVYPDNEIRLELERLADENNTRIWYISKPTTVQVDDIIIDIIPPSEAVLFSGDENDTSLYIRVHYGKFSAVFTGDMTAYSERDLLSRGAVRDVDVLKVAHHGSQTSTSNEFISAASPEYALIGTKENNEYGHPHKDVLSRLDSVEILRTDKHGDIVISADKSGNIEVDYDIK